jgi:PAS domain S-box-containing protein
MSKFDRLMLDHSAELAMLVDPVTLEVVHANASAARALGYPVASLIDMPITEIESALQDVFYWEDVRSGNCQPIETQAGIFRTANHELLAVTKSARPVVHEGQSFILIQAMLTAQEERAENILAKTLSQLRATLESTSNGILVIDWQGRIDSMNHLFGKMWALSPELLRSGEDAQILQVVTRQVVESDMLSSRLSAIVDAGETADVVHHQDGRVFEVNSRPQLSGEQIIGRVFGFQDVTQYTRVEAALRESRDQLEARVTTRTADLNAANARLLHEKELQAALIKKLEEAQNQLLQSERMASIGQLAAGVAHEINNPIGFVNSNMGSLENYVSGLLRLLAAYEAAEVDISPASKETIGHIKDQIDIEFLRLDVVSLLAESTEGLQRVTQIVRDLKSFSHVDEAERQWANIEEGIESTLRVVWNELKYKAQVVKDFAGVPPVWGFPFQLNQVFMNLLLNAGQALEDKGTITIRTGHDERHVWVEIQDDGKGIPPENLQRIFDPFFTTKPVGQGTGLGLSLSYGIVKKHGGTIDVVSQPGQGACFKLVLPKPDAGAPD